MIYCIITQLKAGRLLREPILRLDMVPRLAIFNSTQTTEARKEQICSSRDGESPVSLRRLQQLIDRRRLCLNSGIVSWAAESRL